MSKSLSLKHCIWLCGTVHWVGSVYQTTHLIVKLFKWTFVLKLLIFKKCQRKIRDQTIHLIFCYPTQNKKFNHVSCLKIRSIEKSLENVYQFRNDSNNSFSNYSVNVKDNLAILIDSDISENMQDIYIYSFFRVH